MAKQNKHIKIKMKLTETKYDVSEPQRLPKELVDRLQALEITSFELNFSGGSDEGYLYVDLNYASGLSDEDRKTIRSLVDDVEAWANDTYYYNGAGEGHDYGDDIVYDLVAGTVTCTAWEMVRKDHEAEVIDLNTLPEQP